MEAPPLPASTRRGLSKLVSYMLANEPAARPTAAEVIRVLSELQKRKGGVRQPVIRWAVPLGAALCTLTGAIWFFKPSPVPEPGPVLQPVPFTSLPGSEHAPAFSPDGRQIAFVWNGEQGNNEDIYVQPVGSGFPRRITSNPAPDFSPAWSPDSRQIAFFRQVDSAHLGVMIVPAGGGAERAIARIPGLYIQQALLAWTPDSRHLVITDEEQEPSAGSLVALSINDGRKYKLSSPPARTTDWAPSFSPDGRSFAFIRRGPNSSERLYIKPTQGGAEREAPTGGTLLNSIAWTPDSQQLVFSLGGPTGLCSVACPAT